MTSKDLVAEPNPGNSAGRIPRKKESAEECIFRALGYRAFPQAEAHQTPSPWRVMASHGLR